MAIKLTCARVQFAVFSACLCNPLFSQDMNTITSYNPADVEFERYDEDFVSLVEMVYGQGLLSQGGLASIDELFSGITLDGLKLLDIGSGLGMYDIHLAKKHCVAITAVDPQEKLVEQAVHHLEQAQGELKGSVQFLVLKNPNSLCQFPDHSFDIVFSKETILHISNKIKQEYFNDVYRVVKPGGKIIIMDWMHTSCHYSDTTKKMMEMDGLAFQLLTPQEYSSIIENAGFCTVRLIDKTEQYVLHSQGNIDTIYALQDDIVRQFGQATYDYSILSWEYQRDAFKNKELLVGVFVAEKYAQYVYPNNLNSEQQRHKLKIGD